MVTAHNITTKLDIVKPVQWIGEGDSEATTTLFGVTPDGSTFKLVGNNTEINPQLDIAHADTLGLGSEDILDAVITGRAYAFSIRFNPINVDLLKFIWNTSVAGSDTPRESLSFTYSYNLDGTEHFRHIRGARPTTATWSVQRGLWEADMTFVAKDITIPNVSSGDPATPVYSSSETTAAAISHQDGGGSPFTLNSIVYGEKRFSITVARSIALEDINGELDVVYTKLNDRRVSWSADVVIGTASSETAIETLLEAKTKVPFTYKFNSTGPITFTTANNVITSYSEIPAAGNTDAIIASVSGRSESVTDL